MSVPPPAFWTSSLAFSGYQVNHFSSMLKKSTLSSQSLKKAQVSPALKISSFHSTFPAAIALSPPPHIQSFPESSLSLQSPYAPSHLLLNSLHLMPLASSGDLFAAKAQAQFLILILPETSAVVQTVSLLWNDLVSQASATP